MLQSESGLAPAIIRMAPIMDTLIMDIMALPFIMGRDIILGTMVTGMEDIVEITAAVIPITKPCSCRTTAGD